MITELFEKIIGVKEVESAVKKAEMVLVPKRYGKIENNVCYGCVMTALYCKEHGKTLKQLFEETGFDESYNDDNSTPVSHIVRDWAVEKYGEAFITGLMCGFDDNNVIPEHVTDDQKGILEYYVGYSNGAKLRKEIVPKVRARFGESNEELAS